MTSVCSNTTTGSPNDTLSKKDGDLSGWYAGTLVTGLELHDSYAIARAADGLVRVQMPHGEPAWLATRYAHARFVLGDRRFSRAMAMDRDVPRLGPGKLTDGGIVFMDPPDHTRLRTLVAKAFTIRRVVRAGEPVMVAIGAANRDALRFEDADELKSDRKVKAHLGFGQGVHHCLGVPFPRDVPVTAGRARVR